MTIPADVLARIVAALPGLAGETDEVRIANAYVDATESGLNVLTVAEVVALAPVCHGLPYGSSAAREARRGQYGDA